jgi:hypothetical protein
MLCAEIFLMASNGMSEISPPLWSQHISSSPYLSIPLAFVVIILIYFLFSSSYLKSQNNSQLSPQKNSSSRKFLQENDLHHPHNSSSYSEYEYGTDYPNDGGGGRPSSHPHVIIEPPEKKWLLQSRVANARTPLDFFSIFDEFDILHKLKLPVRRLLMRPGSSGTGPGSDGLSTTEDLLTLTEQTFRDLVRDKININDEPVRVDDAVASSPELFQSYFHNRIKEVISDHLTDLERIDTLALYICCHLSRTRAGGDTLFAVRDIFDSPQVRLSLWLSLTLPAYLCSSLSSLLTLTLTLQRTCM